MNTDALLDGLAWYLCVVLIVTVHEFGHAWMASRCGDDTARDQGRVTLNPAAHIDTLGTVILPLLCVLLPAMGHGALAGFIIGWGKPVPVNLSNLRHRMRDDILISMAGPFMNVVLMLAALVVARLAVLGNVDAVIQAGLKMASISMALFFLNLIPVPPLDGSRVMRYVVGMSEETFLRCSRFGFFALIVLLQISAVQEYLLVATRTSVLLTWRLLGT
jgi:Zn-dependent protease